MQNGSASHMLCSSAPTRLAPALPSARLQVWHVAAVEGRVDVLAALAEAGLQGGVGRAELREALDLANDKGQVGQGGGVENQAGMGGTAGCTWSA